MNIYKISIILFIYNFASSGLFVRADEIVFQGVLEIGSNQRFSLSKVEGSGSRWVSLGDSFYGKKVVEYDSTRKRLMLEGEEGLQEIFMAGVVSGENVEERIPLREAQEVLQIMQFESLMEDTFAAQKEAALEMTNTLLGGDTIMIGDQEKLKKFQESLFDEINKSMDWSELKGDFAKAYDEVFTKSELEAMAQFYSSPDGNASISKQPELQKKIDEIMTPRLIAVMPKIQKMAMDFANSQVAK